MPELSDDPIGPAVDLRAVTPGADYLNPAPRALLVTAAGDLAVECPGALPAFTVAAGQILPMRPTRVLGTTTASVLALY